MARELLTGWLMAAVAFGALPAGSLILLLMMRLIPGAWGEQLRLCAEAACLLTPMAALAFLPIVVGMAWLYPWAALLQTNAFQRVWLNPTAYLVITAAWFLAQYWLSRSALRRSGGETLAASGLIVLVTLSFLVAILWLLSLTPDFASSVFGLQYLLIIVTVAFTGLVLLRLGMHRTPSRPAVIGALLLTLALLGGYFQFLPFFITWSANLPPGVTWYEARGTTLWLSVATFFALADGLSLFALLFARGRGHRRWLLSTSAAMLLAKLAELAWFILPGRGLGAGLAGLVFTLLLAILAVLLLRRALGQRVAARLPRLS